MKNIRHEKLSELIREKVAFIVDFRMQDPRRASLTITITKVDLAMNLSRCTVYYSVLGAEKERNLTQHLLDHAKGFIRSEVAKTLETRRNPSLEFVYDDTIEKTIKLTRRIDEVMGNNPPTPDSEKEK